MVDSSEQDDLRDAHRKLAEVSEQLGKLSFWHTFRVSATAAGKAITAANAATRLRVVRAATHRVREQAAAGNEEAAGVTYAVLDALSRKPMPWSLQDLEAVVALWSDRLKIKLRLSPPQVGILDAVEKFAASADLSERIAAGLAAWLEAYRRASSATHHATAAGRVSELLGTPPELHYEPGEAWSDTLIQELSALPTTQHTRWLQLLQHAGTATGGKPSAKWRKAARSRLDAVGIDAFVRQLAAALSRVDETKRSQVVATPYEHPDSLRNAELLKGLVWCVAAMDDPPAHLARVVAVAAASAYRKVPNLGPRCVAVGNACVWALGHFAGFDGVAQLAWLNAKVKFVPAQKGIRKALDETAERLGIARDEIDELGIPAYGMDRVGLRTESLAGFTAELEVCGAATTELRWRKPDGKLQKGVPKAVKDECAEALAELKLAVKDIKKMLPVQRDRIDAMLCSKREWPLDDFRERYLDHPLVGIVARRLIWAFVRGDQVEAACWHDGTLLAADDTPLPEPSEGTVVRLWHPLDATVDEVVAWREWMERHRVQQPFKQAHREVYLLTDAERATRLYSNRFASHILKQHQFHALCGVRGWRNKLRLLVDADYPPATRELPEWGLRAEFWIEGIGDAYGIDTTESGSYLRVATDQVRFYPIDSEQRHAHASGGGYGLHNPANDRPIPIEDVPARVLSEVLRDVDLFVGVASIGNDPTWQDGGPEGRFVDYWRDYSFGALTASAETRKAVLENLIPKLTIGDRCTFHGRFLVVAGARRTYKIHLGSGNILMEPNDQYLCIVKGASYGHEKLFLPFEGDAMLSLILSKAFLLAQDDRITDQTILSQLCD